MNLPIEARLALEWMQASGERNAQRLFALVDHYCNTNAITRPDIKNAIYDAALQAADRLPGFTR